MHSLTGAVGARFNFVLAERVYFAPFGEYKMNYGKPDFGVRGGLSVGIRMY